MSKKIVFAGGGTGGHIFPGLAIADELKTLSKINNIDIKIYWFGNSGGIDKSIVERSNSVDKFIGIPSGKLRRYFSVQNFFDVFKIFAGFVVSFFQLLILRPAVLFSKGGFVSVPPCIAARLLGIPVFTHECDFTPGLATKINSRFASRILVTYEETKKYFPLNKQSKLIVTGNPVRPAFYNSNPQEGRKFLSQKTASDDDLVIFDKPVLLVLGGSLGAHQLNELVVNNLEWLTKHFIVVHQCGARDKDFVPKRTQNYLPYPFIYEQMNNVIACSDIILSRSGANTIWESAVSGKPSILVPLMGSGTRGDQYDNAMYFKNRGAAFVLSGEEVTDINLRTCLNELLDENKRKQMAECSKKMADGEKPSYKIAQLLFDLIDRL